MKTSAKRKLGNLIEVDRRISRLKYRGLIFVLMEFCQKTIAHAIYMKLRLLVLLCLKLPRCNFLQLGEGRLGIYIIHREIEKSSLKCP
jgi:hypothetical protein